MKAPKIASSRSHWVMAAPLSAASNAMLNAAVTFDPRASARRKRRSMTARPTVANTARNTTSPPNEASSRGTSRPS